MQQIQKCSFCEGRGSVFDKWDQPSTASFFVCEHCKGKGWIEVDTYQSISAQYPLIAINNGAYN